MRLINVRTFRLEEFHDCAQVKYAILSHRWQEQEVLYKDMVQADGKTDLLESIKGFHKVKMSCEEATARDCQYVWVDTCCIDKSSSAELQEAINSMFRWYACAEICFALLSDVQWELDESMFERSQWFERGWTLQELLAPEHLIFFDTHWRHINSRKAMASRISTTTGIPERFLQVSFKYKMDLESRPCIAAIMSWASNRKTTRLEDRAYSLLGLFDVNMPMLYGEGEKAFYRLQVELLQQSEDQSIFAWDNYQRYSTGLLAASPDDFRPTPATALFRFSYSLSRRVSSQVTSEGIHLEVMLVPVYSRVFLALMNLTFVGVELAVWLGPTNNATEYRGHVGVYVCRLDENRYTRIPSPFADRQKLDIAHWPLSHGVSQKRKITVVRRIDEFEIDDRLKRDRISLSVLPRYRDIWMEWFKSKAIEPEGMNADDGFKSAVRWKFYRKKLVVQLEGSAMFALTNTQTQQSCPFGSLVFGSDFDSKFLCLVSMNRGTCYLVNKFRQLLELSDQGFEHHNPFHHHRFLQRGNSSSIDETFNVTSCTGGRYCTMGGDTIAFKKRNNSLLNPLVFRMQIQGGTVIQLAVIEAFPGNWHMFIDLEDSPSFKHDIAGVCQSDGFVLYRCSRRETHFPRVPEGDESDAAHDDSEDSEDDGGVNGITDLSLSEKGIENS